MISAILLNDFGLLDLLIHIQMMIYMLRVPLMTFQMTSKHLVHQDSKFILIADIQKIIAHIVFTSLVKKSCLK